MPDKEPIAWQRITEDTVLGRGPILFWGAVLSHSANASAIFYDGVNASGRRVFSLRTVTSVVETVSAILSKPLLLEDGLYVDLSAAPEDLLVLYESLPG
jgi:hypothetical protein